MIASAVLIPAVGWLGNWLGNRNLFLLSLLVFVGSSVLCGLAWSGPSLILFRVLQGVGGGPITPMVMVFLSAAFPEKQRGLAMGLYGMAAAFGPAVGPVLGGYVTEHLSWRMVFYMNVLPGILCMVMVLLVIPNTREAVRRSLDLPGLCLLVLFLVSLLLALTQGQQYGWDSPYIQRLLLTAGVSCVVFVVLEWRRKEPLVDLRLYTNLGFAGISLAIFINSMVFWGTGFLQTILLQRLLDYTPALAGFVVMPGAIVLAVMMLISGRLADVVDRRYMVWGGLVLFALGSYAFSFLTLERPTAWIIGMIVWRYAAIPFIFTPLNRLLCCSCRRRKCVWVPDSLTSCSKAWGRHRLSLHDDDVTTTHGGACQSSGAAAGHVLPAVGGSVGAYARGGRTGRRCRGWR